MLLFEATRFGETCYAGIGNSRRVAGQTSDRGKSSCLQGALFSSSGRGGSCGRLQTRVAPPSAQAWGVGPWLASLGPQGPEDTKGE